MKRKLVWFVVGFAAILLVCQTVDFPILPIVGVAAISVLLSVFVRPMRIVLPLLIGVLVGCLWLPTYEHIFPESHHIGTEQEVRVVAVAEDYSYPANNENGYWCLCRVESINATPQNRNTVLNVHFQTHWLRLRPGDRVQFDAELLPFENTDDFMEFTYYKTRYIDARAFAKTYEITPCGKIPFRYKLKVLSRSIRMRIDAAFGPAAGLMRALLTGDRNLLTTRQNENFRVTGLSHVVAVSGMHVAFLSAFIILLFGRKRAPFLAVPMILLFGVMIGPIPSVMRAVFMQCVFLFAPLLKQEVDSVTSLAAALGFILIVNPYSILDVGLLLSFGATLGLVLYAPRLNARLFRTIRIQNKFLLRIVRYLVTTFSVSLCAMVFTTPITMLFFGSFSVLAPIANMALLWSVTVLFIGGIVVLIVSIFSTVLAYYVAVPIKFLAMGFLWCVDWMAQIPYALLDAKNPFLISFLIYILAVLVWVTVSKRGSKSLLRVSLLFLLPLVATLTLYITVSARVESPSATVLDVGRGLSVLIETKDETLLVDCGSSSIDAASVVYEKLLRRSNRRIDALVLTHLDTDHISGVEEILGRLHVSKLYLHAGMQEHSLFEDIQNAALANKTEVVLIRHYGERVFQNTRITFFPSGKGKKGMLALNVTSGETDLMITGDMDEKGEAELIEWFELPLVEYYVVGHHGAKSSSSRAFLDRIKPICAVISVDNENPHGHPHKETLKRLNEFCIRILRTDEQGDVKIKF